MKRFSDRSFRTKLLEKFLFIGMVPLVVATVLMLAIFQSFLNRNTAETAQAQLNAMDGDLAGVLSSCEEVMDRLRENEQIRQTLQNGDGASQGVYYTLYDTAGAQLGSAAFSLFSAEGSRVYSTDSRAGAQWLPVNWGLLKAARQSDGTVLRDAAGEEQSCLQAACAVRSGGQVLGYVVLDMTEQHFQRLFDGKYAAGSDVLVLDRFWSEVYASPALRSDDLAASLRQRLLDGQPLGGEEYSYSIRQDGTADLYLVLRQPLPLTDWMMRLLYAVAAVSILLCLGLCTLTSMGVSRQIFEPIRALNSAMGAVEQGDLDVRLTPRSADEMGQLTGRFNRMTERLKENLNESLRQQKELNETQVRMMQAQLNPHFLYNTLDTLKWLGKINQLPEVATISADLADILRSSISGGEFVTLEQELRLVERYVEIQRIRFSGKFQVTLQAPEELRDVLVPKLMLQPLVENAIIHGFEESQGGEITITAAEKQGRLDITVRDNGRGMSEERLRAFRSGEAPSSGHHFGLYNVDAILRLHYGPEYGLQFLPMEGAGTCVSVSLPITRKEMPPC